MIKSVTTRFICWIQFTEKLDKEGNKCNEAPPVGAQSGSRIYQFGGRGVRGNQFPTFDAEFKFAKIQNSHVEDGWVGGGVGSWNSDAEVKFSKIQNSHLEGRGERSWNFNAEFKFAKIQFSHVEGGWGWGGGLWKFDAEFNFAKIQNSHVESGGGGLVEFWCWVQIC